MNNIKKHKFSKEFYKALLYGIALVGLIGAGAYFYFVLITPKHPDPPKTIFTSHEPPLINLSNPSTYPQNIICGGNATPTSTLCKDPYVTHFTCNMVNNVKVWAHIKS